MITHASDTTAITGVSGDHLVQDGFGSSTGLASGPGRFTAGEACKAANRDAVIGEHDDPGSPEEKVNAAAVAVYWASIGNGRPISERRLAFMFGKPSRRWARHRMAEARRNSAAVAADTHRRSGAAASSRRSECTSPARLNAAGQRSGDLLPYAVACLRRAERLDAAAEQVRRQLR